MNLLASLRVLARLLPLLACALLVGCRFGGDVSLFEEDDAIARAVTAIRANMAEENYGGKARVLSITVSSDEVAIRTQDPRDRLRIDEWRSTRVHAGFLNWERLTGPGLYKPVLVNPDLEANLFDLDEVDFSAAGKLIRAAFAHAALEEQAHVGRMEIARTIAILPTPSSGDVRWTVEVGSAHENARIYADTRGTIVGADLADTNRIRKLDFYQRPELLAEAARAFRTAIGTDAILTRVTVGERDIIFATTKPDSAFPMPLSGSLSARAVYKWTPGGLQKLLGSVRAEGLTNPDAPFGINEVDWSALPKVLAQAKDRLGMPKGRITEIEIKKPTDRIFAPVVLWKIEVTDTANREKGSILADTVGTVKQVTLPPSRRKANEWLDPATLVETLARIGRELGPDRQFGVILFSQRDVTITTEDVGAPGGVAQILLSDDGFRPSGSGAVWSQKPFFAIAELAQVTVERIAELEAETLAKLGMPRETLSRVSISHHNTDLARDGGITIEIRTETPGGSGGWVVYALDGSVVRVMRP